MKKVVLLILILSMPIGSGNAQIFKHRAVVKAEKGISNKSARGKTAKVKEPRAVIKAKKKQEANDKKLKSDYEKSTKASQKRTYDIQTPDVQKRMKQNEKDASVRDKAKKSRTKQATKKAGKKYK
jgi:hypothetical protein